MAPSLISGDNILNKILKTHAFDGCVDADLSPLLRLVEDILNPTATEATSQSQGEGNATVLGQLSSVIDRISYEISYKALSKADPESTTMTIFEMVGEYSWEVKLVMSMAAFALNYGNFLLLNQTHSSIRIAKSIAQIRNFPAAGIEQSINPLKELIEAMTNVARCVVEFKELPAAYFSWEAPEFRTVSDHFRVAAYLTVRSIVACSAHITSVTNTSTQTSIDVFGSSTTHQIISITTDSKSQFASFELAGWTQQLVMLHEILMKRLKACQMIIEKKRSEDFYGMLVKLFEASQPDKVKIFEALFCTDGGERRQPLINCSSGTRVGIDMLVEKSVLLFISGLQISPVELVNVKAVYEKHAITHEVVWIPIVDQWAESTKSQFKEQKGLMPWYTMYQPESINNMVIRFVKEKWQFDNKPMILVLGPDGKVVCRDAFHMVQVWGCKAFPFSSTSLDGLWGKVNWNLEFLIQTIEPSDSTVWKWIKEENNLIVLCGGDNFDRVKDVWQLVSGAAGKPGVPSIEVVYAGKSNKWEQVETIAKEISNQKIGYCLGRVNERELFWKRLESMLVSKIQHKVEESDKVLYELQKLLNYDKDKEWTMLCKGSKIIASGSGSSIADALNKYDIWGPNVASDGFEKAFKDHLHGIGGEHRHDCRIELPVTISGSGPANLPMKCPECGGVMKKFITFTCSHESPTTIAVSTTSTTTNTTTTTDAASAALAN